MSIHPQNPDRVTPPVAIGALAGLIIAAIAKSWLDVEVNPSDATTWWNVTTGFVVPLLPMIGGIVGARFKARNDVTPVTPGAAPRDQEGHRLWPLGAMPHTEATGYLPTRLADPAERPRRQPPPTDFP